MNESVKKLAIVGASGHGRVAADIARLNGYKDIVFLDDDLSIKKCGGYDVVGDTSLKLERDYFIGIGNSHIRERLQKLHGDRIVTLIHPDAVIGENVVIGNGSAVMAGTVINPGAIIGEGCIINTCSSVDHDCNIGDFVHVSVGAHIAGTVNIGSHVWIGAGATVSNNININAPEDIIIGAGCVVVKDIACSGTYVGVPAKKIR